MTQTSDSSNNETMILVGLGLLALLGLKKGGGAEDGGGGFGVGDSGSGTDPFTKNPVVQPSGGGTDAGAATNNGIQASTPQSSPTMVTSSPQYGGAYQQSMTTPYVGPSDGGVPYGPLPRSNGSSPILTFIDAKNSAAPDGGLTRSTVTPQTPVTTPLGGPPVVLSFATPLYAPPVSYAPAAPVGAVSSPLNVKVDGTGYQAQTKAGPPSLGSSAYPVGVVNVYGEGGVLPNGPWATPQPEPVQPVGILSFPTAPSSAPTYGNGLIGPATPQSLVMSSTPAPPKPTPAITPASVPVARPVPAPTMPSYLPQNNFSAPAKSIVSTTPTPAPPKPAAAPPKPAPAPAPKPAATVSPFKLRPPGQGGGY